MADDNKSSPPSSPEAAPQPPKREPFFQTVRRFGDYQFSTLLHSLIGLPSSLSPPATNGWILDDDIDPADTPRPRTQRSGSDSIVDEVRKLRDDEERKGGGGGGSGGMGVARTISGPVVPESAPPSTDRKREVVTVGEVFTIPTPVEMLRGFEDLQRELFRPLATPRPDLRRNNTTTATETELDYYSFFERQFRRQNPAPEDAPQGQRRVVEAFSEARSFTGPDGVTKTRRVEMKKFSDGSEERIEREGSTSPPPPRIREIKE
jgi:hypothetical protein